MNVNITWTLDSWYDLAVSILQSVDSGGEILTVEPRGDEIDLTFSISEERAEYHGWLETKEGD